MKRETIGCTVPGHRMRSLMPAILATALLAASPAQADIVGLGAADPANINSQSLRIESQPGTGFECGIVLARHSLHASRNEARPILIDLREVPPESLASWDLVAFPDGCRLRYAGGGLLTTIC